MGVFSAWMKIVVVSNFVRRVKVYLHLKVYDCAVEEQRILELIDLSLKKLLF